ncbi:MAG: NRDE family protein [Cyclobacteriaceae bacterium]|jgi:uncharacterized protein with NRDE domain|nr:NRDE family protein [Cyclobacteriaceae bacterium]
MCLIFLSLRQNPQYPLVIVANRDEFYARHTAPADFWQDSPHVLAGRDLEAGGTWMGVAKSGRLALVTNYRDPNHINPHAPSRGHLVADFLQQPVTPDQYVAAVEKKKSLYNGFNLIVGDANGLSYLSNYGRGTERLSPGFYGLSNHLLDTPWPKVQRGKTVLQERVLHEVMPTQQLLDAMADEAVASDADLPDTGIGLERERALSAMFIKTPNYGTRCSTVVTLDRHRVLTFTERVFDVRTFAYETRTFSFSIES